MYLKDGKIQRETKMAKPLKFKDFINVDYTQTGDDYLAYQAQKRHRGVKGEALSMASRRKLARSLKRNKAKIARGRKKAARRIASKEVLMKRARKQARKQIAQKFTKDTPKDELTFARKKEIEKRLDKMKPRIDRMAKKLLPVVRKKELARKRSSRSGD